MLYLNEAQVIPQALFTAQSIGDRLVVKLLCPAVRERQCAVLVDQLLDAVGKTNGRLVLELSEVQTCTCAWINGMLDLSKRCRAQGGDLLLVGVPEHLRKVLNSTGLGRHLTIVTQAAQTRALLGKAVVEPWKLAVARLLDLPMDALPARAA